jgi:acylpyruvate hydrolase
MSTFQTFSIRNIWAVGRNYADHAKELGNTVPSSESDPMIFLKAGSSAVFDGGIFTLPGFSHDIQHEIEVALRFDGSLQFSELTLAVDLTARDVQNALKAKGHPWTLAKSFRSACLVGPMMKIPADLDLQNIEFHLKTNGAIRQKGHTGDMIHSVEKLRRYVVERFPVVEGDLLLTGTPAGVSALKPGDRLEAEIPGRLKATWTASDAHGSEA